MPRPPDRPAPAVPLPDAQARGLLQTAQGLERQGRAADAMAAYQRAAQHPLTRAVAASRMGHLLLATGRTGEAAQAFRAAAAAAPNDPERRMDLVRALSLEKKDAEAEAEARAVLAAHPDHADGWWVLGRFLSEAGRFDAAREAFARSAALDPGQGLVFYDLVRSYRLGEADRPLVETIRAQLKAGGGADRRMRLNLALGKALDDLDEPQAAMAAFAAAAQARGEMTRFDRAAIQARTDATLARFTPEFFARHAGAASDSERPMFVLGMPRSGTTLVEQILSSHPDVAGGGELGFWNARAAMFGQLPAGGDIAAFQRRTAGDGLAMLEALSPGAPRVIDKTPQNFRWAGLIHLVFPKAVIVHVRRDPRDVGLSIATTYFSPRAELPTFGEDLVFYWRQYARLMDHWRQVLPAERFVEVDYEALVADPEAQTRRLVGACGLSWDEACLHPERNTRLVKTPSKWQARQPIAAGSVGRWRRYEPWLGALAGLGDGR